LAQADGEQTLRAVNKKSRGAQQAGDEQFGLAFQFPKKQRPNGPPSAM